MTRDLLFEVGVEELPAECVRAAVTSLPELMRFELAELGLAHGTVRAYGTPRRLALVVDRISVSQSDLDERVLGPPIRVAFDGNDRPTQAAESFASRINSTVDDLFIVETERGKYVAGLQRARGASAVDLLPRALERVCHRLHFKQRMRWGNEDTPFGRPVRWLLALFGDEPLSLSFAGKSSGDLTFGHRFISPDAIELRYPNQYVDVLREHHVLVDIDERRAQMLELLRLGARQLGGVLIEDDFLIDENMNLVEEPQVIDGSFAPEFLDLPEPVILQVAKGHQRYFGVRDRAGRLMPNYLVVVNTALNRENIRRGNDRVMRARLSDAEFFYKHDMQQPLSMRRHDLDGITFHERLGSVGDKVQRIARLIADLGEELKLETRTIHNAREAALLAKCDLTTRMVAELPELEGFMGEAYGLAQGVPPEIARAIGEHYRPRGADDATAQSDAGALLGLADRLDTLVGCFGIGIVPSGAADPLALRRAAIGWLRTVLAKRWEVSVSRAARAAYRQYSCRLEFSADETVEKLRGFLRHRLRGILTQPRDVVDACLAVSSDRPYDVSLRAAALASIEPVIRISAGEVFKRALKLAKHAPEGPAVPPDEIDETVHPSEQRLFDELSRLKEQLAAAHDKRDYPEGLAAVAGFAPTLGKFFDDVYVLVDDETLRDNRLRLLREVHRTCSFLANFNLLVH